MHLLSANGTLRTILILLILWQLLRFWMRIQNNAGRAPDKGPSPPGRNRAPGELRIEQLKEIKHHRPPEDAEDADFEVIK